MTTTTTYPKNYVTEPGKRLGFIHGNRVACDPVTALADLPESFVAQLRELAALGYHEARILRHGSDFCVYLGDGGRVRWVLNYSARTDRFTYASYRLDGTAGKATQIESGRLLVVAAQLRGPRPGVTRAL